MNDDKSSGNLFELLIDGETFFPRMIDAITSARHHVLMEMYLVESGRITTTFVNAFVDAAARGVVVQLILDDFGARGLSRNDKEHLINHGVQVVFYNPLQIKKMTRNLWRTHRKLIVVDDNVAFVGGLGLADEFAGQSAWRETMVQIEGPIVSDWRDLFVKNWNRWSDLPAPPVLGNAAPAGDMVGRVASTHRERRTDIKRAFLTRVNGADECVWFTTAYFIPSRKVRRAFRRAARRGVDVRILVPGPETDHPAVRQASRRFYARLLRHGVRIFEYQERFMHAKVLLVDNWCSIGSSNLDRWGLQWNLEANQEIETTSFTVDVRTMLTTDFDHSNEIVSDVWRQRGMRNRLKERFWGRIDLWLTNLRP